MTLLESRAQADRAVLVSSHKYPSAHQQRQETQNVGLFTVYDILVDTQ